MAITRAINLYDSLELLRQQIDDQGCDHEDILPNDEVVNLLSQIDGKLDEVLSLLKKAFSP